MSQGPEVAADVEAGLAELGEGRVIGRRAAKRSGRGRWRPWRGARAEAASKRSAAVDARRALGDCAVMSTSDWTLISGVWEVAMGGFGTGRRRGLG